VVGPTKHRCIRRQSIWVWNGCAWCSSGCNGKQPRVPVITIAGTNGKGSVSAYCVAILRAAGFKVGSFTSPHLRDYRERIQLHDRWVHAAELTEAFEKIEVARGSVGLTFFEFNALAALLIFDAAALDAWVLEIGMGGRLDAVNVVDGDVAVITSIGLDHQEYLGDTLEDIAREKAGIFRPGKTAVIGGREPSLVLEEVARGMNSPLKRLAIEYNYILDGAGLALSRHPLGLAAPAGACALGAIQFTNAATAIAALEEIAPRLNIPAAAIARGLAEVRLPGRFQLIAPAEGAPRWVLDVAHNPDAALGLARNLNANPVAGKTLAVCGILMDKDAAGIAAIMDGCIDAWWCASIDGARGRSGEALANVIRDEVAVPVCAADSVASACQAALSAAGPQDRIVVFGSFHTVGPAIDWLESQGLLPPTVRPEYTPR